MFNEESKGSSGRASGSLKFKRKSELKNPIGTKSRISIKGENKYEFIMNEEDPFNHSRSSVAGLRFSKIDPKHYEERKSRVSSFYQVPSHPPAIIKQGSAS